jgi:hypothetical protein
MAAPYGHDNEKGRISWLLEYPSAYKTDSYFEKLVTIINCRRIHMKTLPYPSRSTNFTKIQTPQIMHHKSQMLTTN